MNVTYEILENPLWIEYSFSSPISKTEKLYESSTEAQHSPLASKIFGFPWVDNVKISPLSLKVLRQDWVDFDIIAEPLKSLIEEHFSSLSNIEENPEPPVYQNIQQQEELSEDAQKVIQFLDSEVNPQIAAHGGSIKFIELKDKKLLLKMQGGCQGCSMAQATLNEGVAKSLVENFDFISEVIDTTDHSSGIKPFYS